VNRGQRIKAQRLFELLGSVNGEGPWEDPDELRQADFQARAAAAGADFKLSALEYLLAAGAIVVRGTFHRCQVPVDAEIEGDNGQRLIVLARGTPDDTITSGLRRLDTVQKVGFVAMVLASEQASPILIVTSHLPRHGTAAATQLTKLKNHVADVIATTGDLRGYQRLLAWLRGEPPVASSRPWTLGPDPAQPGLWD